MMQSFDNLFVAVLKKSFILTKGPSVLKKSVISIFFFLNSPYIHLLHTLMLDLLPIVQAAHNKIDALLIILKNMYEQCSI